MAMVDLDHFKLLNDTYGHQVGDDCLIQIGTVLKKFSKRPSDICARYGGEEFVLVWGDTPLEHAKQLTTTLLQEINALKIDNINSPIESYLTASVGLAAIIPSQSSREHELVGKADSMLYRAKERGRNRVES
ncbi:MAG: GGDEF domain-containing protein [Gammaproteobacteria bacterium]